MSYSTTSPVEIEAGDRVCIYCFSNSIEGSLDYSVDFDTEDWDHACSLCGNDYCETWVVQAN